MGYDHSIRCRRGERRGEEGSDLATVCAAAAATAAGGLALPLSPLHTPGALLDSKPAFPPFSVKIPNVTRSQNIASRFADY